jgi:integrase
MFPSFFYWLWRLDFFVQVRHVSCVVFAAGIPLKTVSYRAGHAQTSTTTNIYSHAIRTADEKAAEVLVDALGLKR